MSGGVLRRVWRSSLRYLVYPYPHLRMHSAPPSCRPGPRNLDHTLHLPSTHPWPQLIREVVLGDFLGAGYSGGKVFRATWRGSTVALKLMVGGTGVGAWARVHRGAF